MARARARWPRGCVKRFGIHDIHAPGLEDTMKNKKRRTILQGTVSLVPEIGPFPGKLLLQSSTTSEASFGSPRQSTQETLEPEKPDKTWGGQTCFRSSTIWGRGRSPVSFSACFLVWCVLKFGRYSHYLPLVFFFWSI